MLANLGGSLAAAMGPGGMGKVKGERWAECRDRAGGVGWTGREGARKRERATERAREKQKEETRERKKEIREEQRIIVQ